MNIFTRMHHLMYTSVPYNSKYIFLQFRFFIKNIVIVFIWTIHCYNNIFLVEITNIIKKKNLKL